MPRTPDRDPSALVTVRDRYNRPYKSAEGYQVFTAAEGAAIVTVVGGMALPCTPIIMAGTVPSDLSDAAHEYWFKPASEA